MAITARHGCNRAERGNLAVSRRPMPRPLSEHIHTPTIELHQSRDDERRVSTPSDTTTQIPVSSSVYHIHTAESRDCSRCRRQATDVSVGPQSPFIISSSKLTIRAWLSRTRGSDSIVDPCWLLFLFFSICEVSSLYCILWWNPRDKLPGGFQPNLHLIQLIPGIECCEWGLLDQFGTGCWYNGFDRGKHLSYQRGKRNTT